MEPLLLKAGDVAKLLGLGRSKVFAMLAIGELPVDTIRRTQAAASTGRSEGLRRNRSAWELVEDLVGLYVKRCFPSIETTSIVVISPPKIWVGGVCPSRIEARRNPT